MDRVKNFKAGYVCGLLDSIEMVEEAATIQGAVIKLLNMRIHLLIKAQEGKKE